ncbi:DUF3078 domain-containing protein [Flavobacterium sp.]|uniref:DUF3078 domain-containing protein n=1 Tax=Flavobacterium sp. TaxID=239 RepID=UPI003D0F0E7E
MKKVLPFLFLLLFSQNLLSQEIITALPDTISHWKKQHKLGIDINQISFVNWNAGGTNSISGLLKGDIKRIYQYKNTKWHNELLFRYGINKQDGLRIRKTDDALVLNSTFGFRTDTISNWFYSAKFNFNTQLTNGYQYPNTNKAISSFFAPAYLFLGAGAEYINKEQNLKIYLSPLTQKSTFVLDTDLSNEGAFGVQKGKKYRNEIGFLVSAYHKDEVFRNVFIENRANLYSDYLNNFGNIDINWQIQVDMVVNKYLTANVGTHLVYDDDVKAKEEIDGVLQTVGPKLQVKQIIGIGLTYVF